MLLLIAQFRLVSYRCIIIYCSRTFDRVYGSFGFPIWNFCCSAQFSKLFQWNYGIMKTTFRNYEHNELVEKILFIVIIFPIINNIPR